jgi:hypothetical protein
MSFDEQALVTTFATAATGEMSEELLQVSDK